MLEADFKRQMLAILREYSDAWQKIGPLGYVIILPFTSKDGRPSDLRIHVKPRKVYVPEPPRGSYTGAIWTCEADGLAHAFRILGPPAIEMLRECLPKIAERILRGDPEVF